MDKVIITGGAGFIGSHVVERLVRQYSDISFVVVDKLTYAGSLENLKFVSKEPNFKFIQEDICDYEAMLKVTSGASVIINMAAESHVDNSFLNSLSFTKTNTFGTHVLLECCIHNDIGHFLHVSTDEVYGENNTKLPFIEDQYFNPTNPYSASKAGAEMIIKSYEISYGLKNTIVRANNIFGPRQFPEKLIPRTFVRLKSGLPAILHGSGENKRCFLHVNDFCDAISLIFSDNLLGCFNIASDDEYENREVVRMICEYLDLDFATNTLFVSDRPHNDTRYLISSQKIKLAGWKQKIRLQDEIDNVFLWYENKIYSIDELKNI